MTRRLTAVLGAVALAAWAGSAEAQARPDFSGTWTLDAEKTAAANPAMGQGGGGGGGQRGGRMGGMGMGGGTFTLKQDATSLTREAAGRNGTNTVTFKLDGSAVEAGQGPMAGTARAKWDGSKLVIETTREFNGNTMVTREVYWLEDGLLVREATMPGRQGGAGMTMKAYFRKN